MILSGFFIPIEHKSHFRHSHEYFVRAYYGIETVRWKTVAVVSAIILVLTFLKDKTASISLYWLTLVISVPILLFLITFDLLDFGQTYSIQLDKGFSVILIGGIILAITCGVIIHTYKELNVEP